MVTPRKIYTPEERSKIAKNPLKLIAAYQRKSDVGVVVEVRYDASLAKDDCSLNKSASVYTEKSFFLIGLHYEQLKFTIRCLKWKLRISFAEFLSLFNDLIKNVPDADTPVIIRLVVKKTGNIKGEIMTTPPLKSMFSGILSHSQLALAPPADARDENGSCFVSIDADPILVCIDPDPTLPCYATSFDLDNAWAYDEATKRVREYCENLKTRGKSGDSPCSPSATTADSETEKQLTENADPELNVDFSEIEIAPLMYNTVHQVMSCGKWVLCFFRNGKWVTPHISTGCRNDPLRMFLLEKGVIEEAIVRIQGIEKDEAILLMSAVGGIQPGYIIGNTPEMLYKHTRSRWLKRKAKKAIVETNRMNAAFAAEESSRLLSQQGIVDKKIPNTGVFRIAKKRK